MCLSLKLVSQETNPQTMTTLTISTTHEWLCRLTSTFCAEWAKKDWTILGCSVSFWNNKKTQVAIQLKTNIAQYHGCLCSTEKFKTIFGKLMHTTPLTSYYMWVFAKNTRLCIPFVCIVYPHPTVICKLLFKWTRPSKQYSIFKKCLPHNNMAFQATLFI